MTPSPLLSYLSHLSISSAHRFSSTVLSALELLAYLFMPKGLADGLGSIIHTVIISSGKILTFILNELDFLIWFKRFLPPLSSIVLYIFRAIAFLQTKASIWLILKIYKVIFSNLKVKERFFHMLFDILLFFWWLTPLPIFEWLRLPSYRYFCIFRKCQQRYSFHPLILWVDNFFIFIVIDIFISTLSTPYLFFHFLAHKIWL